MMTRREKLLIRPWQLRKYNNHKKKVVNATPIVDFGPPPQRKHVAIKLKKLQKERERQMKIEEDNFKLLQHLSSIMRQKRVDNYWEAEPPTFLRRVGIYSRTRTPTPWEETSPVTTPETSTITKSKCFACTPHLKPPATIPEERIPWEPPKRILNRRSSTSAIVSSSLEFGQAKHFQERISTAVKKSSFQKAELPVIISREKDLIKMERGEQKIVVRQGPIQIAVNFPSFAEVKLVRGKSEKYLQTNHCDCKMSFQEKINFNVKKK